jgi:predicted RNA-binding Zn ribbon-like protein
MGAQTDLAFQKEDEVIPPPLRLVRDFVNTVEYQLDDEGLREPADLGAWLSGHGLLETGAAVNADDLAFAKQLREGLRGVLELHAGHEADAAAVRRLNEALVQLPMRVQFVEAESFELAPAGADPVRRALGGLLDAVRRSIDDGTWPRLKACARGSCRWAYYDHSRNRSSRWCTMAGCGNAVKMKKAYAARRGRDDANG